MATIALEGLKFFAYHGVYAEEAEKGNHFVVDLWLDMGSTPLNETDELAGTVDYSEVYELVKGVMGERVNLLETLVAKTGRRLMEQFEGVRSARVRVSKLNPPFGGNCIRAYVEQEFVA